MAIDFEDLINWHTEGFALALGSIMAAYISCVVLYFVRAHTIEVEHKLLDEDFMSFHVSHGMFGTVCHLAFSAERVKIAHRNAIRYQLYDNDDTLVLTSGRTEAEMARHKEAKRCRATLKQRRFRIDARAKERKSRSNAEIWTQILASVRGSARGKSGGNWNIRAKLACEMAKKLRVSHLVSCMFLIHTKMTLPQTATGHRTGGDTMKFPRIGRRLR